MIRNEKTNDIPMISRIITDAFLTLAQSTGREAAIVDKLRAQNALVLSLVAEENNEVVGYLAVSKAQIGEQEGWALLGPLAVLPSKQNHGIGTKLITQALSQLKSSHIGVALVGDPSYYSRFGFENFSGLTVKGCPPEFVQALPFDSANIPQGELIHHPAFN